MIYNSTNKLGWVVEKNIYKYPATFKTTIGQSITKLSASLQVFACVLLHYKRAYK